MAIALSVNLNKIALLRNSRPGNYPSVMDFAHRCLDGGADGLTVHPRPDQRHIRATDLAPLARLLRPLGGIEFNVEGNPFAPALGTYPGLLELVQDCQPDQCTLVPDANDQLTSDHGFDLHQSGEKLLSLVDRLKQLGIRVSLFMDPDPEQIKLAKDLGAHRIELYTGPYAAAFKSGTEAQWLPIWQAHRDAAALAQQLGLGVNAGHDLNLLNLPKYAEIPPLQEVSIGHALTVDALELGFSQAVAAYKRICTSAAC